MFTFESENREFGAEADELPRPLRALRRRRSAATASCRCAWPRPASCIATSWPARCTACCACACSRRTTRTSSARPSRSRTRCSAASSSATRSTTSSGSRSSVELSTRPENKLGTDEEWDVAEAALREALERRGIEYTVNEGDGAFYGPKIDLHMLDSLGRSWQIGTVQLDFQMPQRFGLALQGRRQRRAHPGDDPPRADRLVRALHRDPDRALRRRLPVLARAGAGAGDPGRRRATARPRTSSPRGSARLPGRGRRVRRDRRQADPQRRARQDPVHGRLRRQGERRRRWRSASTAASSPRSRLPNCSELLATLSP